MKNRLTIAQQIRQGGERARDAIAVKKLALFVLKSDVSGLILRENDSFSDKELAEFEGFMARLEGGEPVHRIIGRREFHGMEFELSDATLEPRDDSECLVEHVLQQISDRQKPFRFLDLGTGTGIIALALLSELPNAHATLTDISEKALQTARKNVAALGFADRVTTACGSWFEPVDGQFDFIVSNPPYIETLVIDDLSPQVRNFDPPAALDGGADGLDAYRVILESAKSYLGPAGFLGVEIGFDQRFTVTEIAKQSNWQSLTHAQDLGGNDRSIVFNN